MNTTYSKKQQTRLKDGKCRDCGKEKKCQTTLCEKCKSRVSNHMKLRRERRKSSGLCVDCGEKIKSKNTACRTCLDKRNIQQQEKRQKCLMTNRCYDCGSSIVTKHKRCQQCENKKKTLRTLRENRLNAKGLCISCGKCSYMKVFEQKNIPQKICKCCYLKKRSSTQLGSTKHWKKLLDILEKQEYKCIYSGEKLCLGKNASIDHIYPKSRFPKKQFDITNIQWTTKSINLMKNDLTHDEFIAFARNIIQLEDNNRMLAE